jgi:purine nucleosidase
VTERTVMSTTQIAEIGQIDTDRARFASQILPFYRDFHVRHGGPDGIFVHDSTCISYLLAPQHYGVVHHPIRVDCGAHVARGKTLPALRHTPSTGPWDDRRPVTILTDVDSDAVVALELEHLARGHRPAL